MDESSALTANAGKSQSLSAIKYLYSRDWYRIRQLDTPIFNPAGALNVPHGSTNNSKETSAMNIKTAFAFGLGVKVCRRR